MEEDVPKKHPGISKPSGTSYSHRRTITPSREIIASINRSQACLPVTLCAIERDRLDLKKTLRLTWIRSRAGTHVHTHIYTRVHLYSPSHCWLCHLRFAYSKRMKHCLDRNLIFGLIVPPYVLQDISKQSSACYLLQLVICMLLHTVILSYLFKNKFIHKYYSCYRIREA